MIESTPALTSPRRRELRAAAHHLNPVVSIGHKGLQPSVLAEIDRSLKSHELIKVRLYGQEREVRDAMCTEICSSLKCAEVQQIGNLLVLWRENPKDNPAAILIEPHKRTKKLGNKKQLAAYSTRQKI